MTGFRIKSPLSRVFKNLRDSVKASAFEPDVSQFLKRSLTTAIQLTPARNAGLIRRNQKKQYAHRINYIPSFHELIDPTLIVKKDGSQWLYANLKWWRPDVWHLPDDIWVIYQDLVVERERRLETEESAFIAERQQARFLYKKSWWEVGQSVGIDVPCSQQVKDAHSRRNASQLRNGHSQNPPKGYAQRRGGKGIYSIVVYNPFLDEQTQYWLGNGKEILAQAMQKHRAAFDDNVAKRQTSLILKILKFFL